MRFHNSIVLALIFVLSMTVYADSYGTFQTTRYYSTNQQYFVEVNEKQLATLYKNAPRPKRLWSHSISQLPRDLLVMNDGSRFVIIDSYYGNNHDPKAPVILTYDDKGNEMSRYSLADVANLSRVAMTTSQAYWFGGAWFASDARVLVVQTIVTKVDWGMCLKNASSDQGWMKCSEPIPFEQLHFDLNTGKLSERTKLVQ
jgi:hypothetical protein